MRHRTELLKAGSKIQFGHRTGWLPRTHSTGKFFLWFHGFLTIFEKLPVHCEATQITFLSMYHIFYEGYISSIGQRTL